MGKRNIIVLGMARSGTSMTAGIFANNGYFVGDVWSHGSSDNPMGYHESEMLVNLNVKLLRRAGFRHHNTWAFEPVSQSVIKAIAAFAPTDEEREFVHSYEKHVPWVWKDIRLCFTLPVWLQILDLEATRFILVRRRPQGIHHSIMRNDAKKSGDSSLAAIRELTEQHIQQAKNTLEAVSARFVELHYEACFTTPREVAEMLSEFTGLALEAKDLGARANLNHDSYKDRLLTSIRRSLNHPRLAPVKRMLRWIVPQRLARWAFPENSIRP